MNNNDEVRNERLEELTQQINKKLQEQGGSKTDVQDFLSFLVETFDLEDIEGMFYDLEGNMKNDEVCLQYFMFVHVLDWYNTILSEG